MVSRFVRRAPAVFLIIHGMLWAVVVVVWSFAWRVEPAPMGPPFNFAKRFISRIDVFVSSPLDGLSVSVAVRAAKSFGADVGLVYAILFGCLILVCGSVQWFLIGRFVQWVGIKYGQGRALVLSGGVACGVSLAFVSWVMSW